jgi:hypothetical protein
MVTKAPALTNTPPCCCLHSPGKLPLLLLPALWPMHDEWPLGHVLHTLAGGGALIFPHVFENCLNLHFTLVTQEHAFARHHQACTTTTDAVFLVQCLTKVIKCFRLFDQWTCGSGLSSTGYS